MGTFLTPSPGPPPPREIQENRGPDESLAALFHDHQGLTALANTMRDLAVTFQPAAEAWAHWEVGKIINVENPVLRALNFLLAGTAEGDWEGARNALLHGELGTLPEVSAILTCSAFEGEPPTDDNGNPPPRLQQAQKDCQQRLEQLKLTLRQREISRLLQTATDGETRRNLLRESQEVARAIVHSRRRLP